MAATKRQKVLYEEEKKVAQQQAQTRNQELVKMQEEQRKKDVNKRMLIERGNAEREKRVYAINTTFEHIGGGLCAILTDQNKLVVVVGGVTALAACICTTRQGARVVWSYVDRILGQPSLIKESSRGKYPWSGDKALDLWEDMKRKKLNPDSITALFLIWAYTHYTHLLKHGNTKWFQPPDTKKRSSLSAKSDGG
ncbi:hypothetical protein M8C21_004103 [Ambrosia artemisiifolia]|uniref:ATPase family AAA domain-containing protein n=1 Tax=Ambrosia artemisiifolia TaxID=4212 RepID=A0AAD5CEH9_AMBAR|nr:hypothetical protein M8C21_004103 [Ambrosia artemisiifolia]